MTTRTSGSPANNSVMSGDLGEADRNHTGGVFIPPTIVYIVCFEFNTRSSCNVKRMEKRRREVKTTNLLALNS